MFPEPPDPKETWIKGLILLVFMFSIYAFVSQGIEALFGFSSSENPQTPYQIEVDGETD